MGRLARRHVYLFLLVVFVPASVQVFVWIADAIENYRTPPPVKTVRAFLAALSSGRMRDDACERAMSLLTAESRDVFSSQEREARGSRAGSASRSSACSLSVPAARVFVGLRPTTARLASLQNGRAIIDIERYEADPTSFRMPGFWPSRWIVTRAEMRLVEEAGRWKIALQ